eukprot:7387818-Prymnesium_polylepis.1
MEGAPMEEGRLVERLVEVVASPGTQRAPTEGSTVGVARAGVTVGWVTVAAAGRVVATEVEVLAAVWQEGTEAAELVGAAAVGAGQVAGKAVA